jgi:hypothetical protein
VDSVLAKVQAAGSLLEARWSVSTVCHANLEPLAFGAPCSRPNASMVEITVPTTPRAARRRQGAVRSDSYGGQRRLNSQQHDWV